MTIHVCAEEHHVVLEDTVEIFLYVCIPKTNKILHRGALLAFVHPFDRASRAISQSIELLELTCMMWVPDLWQAILSMYGATSTQIIAISSCVADLITVWRVLMQHGSKLIS